FSLTVNNVAPTATLSNNGPITYGSSATVNFSSQFDPSSADTSAGFHYAYSLDDGGSSLSTATYGGSGTSASSSFSALNAGPHTVYARTIDKDDGYTQYSTVVTVNKGNASITITPYHVTYDAS